MTGKACALCNLETVTVQKEREIQIPTRITEKIVVALFSGILVNSGILVVAETTN